MIYLSIMVGQQDVAGLVEETPGEERGSDGRFTEIALSAANRAAI